MSNRCGRKLEDGVPPSGALVGDAQHHRVLGAHYEADACGSAWFTPEMRALQARVDALLPGRVSRSTPPD